MPDYDLAIDNLAARRAQASSALSGDTSPDDAARALQLSRATGTPADSIASDLKGYDEQTRRAIGSHIIENNQNLADFIGYSPTRGALVKDDLGNLNDVSRTYDGLSKSLGTMAAFGRAISNIPTDIGGFANRNAAVLYEARKRAENQQGGWAPGASFGERMGELANIAGGLTGLLFSPLSGTGEALYGRERAKQLAEKMREQIGTPYPGYVPPDNTEADEALAQDIGEAVGQLIPGLPKIPRGSRLSTPEEIDAFINSARGHAARAEIDEFLRKKAAGEPVGEPPVGATSTIEQAASRPNEVLQEAEPFIKDGKPPPVGLSPEIDAFHAAQTESDAKGIQDVLEATTKTALRERDPEAIEQFIASHGEHTIGIDSSAVRQLYGDKPPASDDKLLGFIPNLAKRLPYAETYGGDIEVPLSTWLARVEPDVAKQLSDFIRVRPGGMTPQEVKEGIQTYHGSPADFDQFSSAFIKTGQGATTYGEGHYVAQEGKVAEDYQKTVGGKLDPEEAIAKTYLGNADSREEAIANIRKSEENLQQAVDAGTTSWRTQLEEHARARQLLEQGWEPPKGNLYTVRVLRDEGDFLDRDLALRDQPLGEVARKAVENDLLGMREKAKGRIEELGKETSITNAAESGRQGSFIDQLNYFLGGLTNSLSVDRLHEIYESLGADKGELEDVLNKAGIAGFKYLDQFSRRSSRSLEQIEELIEQNKQDIETLKTEMQTASGADAGVIKGRIIDREEDIEKLEEEKNKTQLPQTRNFVVFNDKDLQITHKNGVPVREAEREAVTKEALGLKVLSRERGPSKRDIARRQAAGLQPRGLRPTQSKALMDVVRLMRGIQRISATRALIAESGFTTTALARSMTADMFRKYQDLIRKEIEEDATKREELEKALATVNQTVAWKKARETLEPQVRAEVLGRPEILASRALRTKAGQAADPDELARTLGYSSGDEMKAAVKVLDQDRGSLSVQAHENKLVRDELDRQLQANYGKLSSEIIKEAKLHVFRPTVMDRIHEEVQALGMDAGAGAPITKQDLRSWVKEAFAETPGSSIDSDKFYASAGKMGRKAEQFLLKGEKLRAFQAKQQQEIALAMGNEAIKFEDKMRQMTNRIARYVKRDGPANRNKEYTHQIQRILQNLGIQIQRTPADLADNILRDGTGSLENFVKTEIADMQPLDVADWIIAGEKKYKELTAEEMLGLHTSLKIMDEISRRSVSTVTSLKTGKTLDDVLNEMQPLMERFKKIPFDYKPGWTDKVTNALSSLQQTETLLKHWDHHDRYGPFQTQIIHQIMRSAGQHKTWQRDYGKLYEAIGKIEDPDKPIKENPYLLDPRDGRPLNLTRKDVVGIVSHFGNPSNEDKFLKGWKIISTQGTMEDWTVRQEFRDWLIRNTRPGDWKRAEQLGGIFNKIFHEISQPMYHRLTGDTIEALELTPFSNPHGTFKGWYHPISYIAEFDRQKAAIAGRGLISPDFKNMLPSNPYSKARTGYYSPVEYRADIIPLRLNQMLFDGAYREAVIDVRKLFRQRKFRDMVSLHWGQPAMEGLDHWLQYIVNGSNINEPSLEGVTRAMAFFRQNAVQSYVGNNIGTMAKHGPTAALFSGRDVGFARIVGQLGKEVVREVLDRRTLKQEDDFMLKSSSIMPHRRTSWEEGLGAAQNALEGGGLNAFMRARARWQHFQTAGVAFSDWISAKALWKLRYKDAFRETKGNHDLAVDQADASVRQQHGDTAAPSLPPAVRGAGEIAKWNLSFFTFFGTRGQRMTDLVRDANEAWDLGVKEGELRKAAKMIPKLAADYTIYVAAPILIDLAVAGSRVGIRKALFVAMILGPLASIPFIRDLYHSFVEGGDPDQGLLGSVYKDLNNIVLHMTRKAKPYFTKANAEQMVGDFFTVMGQATGILGKAVGRPFKYLAGLKSGEEKPPKGPGDIIRGVRFGTSKEFKK